MIWRTERRKIADLNPAAYNPRVMDEGEVSNLKTSLDTFDVVDPIIINTNNNIIGGHQRARILAERGVEEVDVRVPDRELTLDEEMELNLRLNKNTGRFDFDALANFDESLLKAVGFGEKELQEIFTDAPEKEVNLPYKVIFNFKDPAEWDALLAELSSPAKAGRKSRNVDGSAAVARLRGLKL